MCSQLQISVLKDNLSKADAEVHELDKIVDQVREVSGEKLLMKICGKPSSPPPFTGFAQQRFSCETMQAIATVASRT